MLCLRARKAPATEAVSNILTLMLMHARCSNILRSIPTLPTWLPAQEAGLVPAASQVLLTDVLFLVRDAIDLALGLDSPTPRWAGAYGYLPDRSPFFPLLELVPEPAEGEASADALPAEAQPGRRLRQAAAASGAAPLPWGHPPATALLEGAAEYGGEEYGEEDAAAYEELYDAAYYG